MSARFFLFWLFLGLCAPSIGRADDAPSPALPLAKPAEVGMDSARLERIDGAIQEGIDHGLLPGGVILVIREGKIVYRNAYGLRTKQPVQTPMTVDTAFDLASLTKPLPTATSLIIPLDQ